MTATEDSRGPWSTEAVDIVRAVSGGLLFGIPLLFTMEVWWIGSSTEPGPTAAVLLLTFVVVVALNRTSGFRSTKDVLLREALMDGVEAVALGVISVAALLFVLQEITLDTPLREILGKTVYEAMPFGIGIALAAKFLRKSRSGGEEDGDQQAKGRLGATAADLAGTVIGAVFISFSIAPTDEIPMLSATLGPVPLLALVGVSLIVSFCIVFVAGFSNQEQRHAQKGILQHPVTETAACYLIALVCSAAMLWFFQRLDLGAPWSATVRDVIILGLPASVGGAAGRLAV